MKIYLGEIYTRYMAEEKKEQLFELQREIIVELSTSRHLEIPKYFVTDFASVPKFFWSIIGPIGKFNLASVIHDYFYTYHTTTRALADKEFYLWMKFTNPKAYIRNTLMYWGVRLFGAKRWRYYGNGI